MRPAGPCYAAPRVRRSLSLQPEPRTPLAARLVCGRPPRLPVARDARSLCRARQRGHAPADPGVANRRAIPGVPGPLSDRQTRSHPPRPPPSSRRGAASGTTAALSPSSGRRRSSRATAGHATWPVCRSCRGSARTPRARSPRSRSTLPSGWSTPTCGAGSSDASADRTSRRRLQGLADALAAPGQGAEVAAWTHASMEFGAAICRSRDPRCDSCPVARGCPSRGTARKGRGRSPAAPARLRPRLSRRGAAAAVRR